MMKNIFLALFVTFLAGSTVNAFWKPTRPVQQAAVAFSSGDSFLASLDAAAAASSFDAGLDNTAIAADGNITPSRKWYVPASLVCVPNDAYASRFYYIPVIYWCVVCVSHRHLLVVLSLLSFLRYKTLRTNTYPHS